MTLVKKSCSSFDTVTQSNRTGIPLWFTYCWAACAAVCSHSSSSCRASSWQIMIRVALPQAMPQLLHAMRLALGPAWVFLISAEAIASADALLIGAGAGMGVDSGLPDFRGNEGFWNAYPVYRELGLDFARLANPGWFRKDPMFAWGFYGHRLNLYRNTSPHAGFHHLKRWSDRFKFGSFVYTSNVDGHFQKAGFSSDRILECHGAIERCQCMHDCGVDVFPTPPFQVNVDPKTCRASGPVPECPSCGGPARPNILMFGDGDWDPTVTRLQESAFANWLHRLKEARVVVIECGAGIAIPTVRSTCEAVALHAGGTLIRVNVRDPDVRAGGISLPMGALDAITAIGRQLGVS